MAIYRIKTFADLVSGVREEAGIQSNDTISVNKIKRDINIVYSDIASRHRWNWLRGYTTLNFPAYFGSSGTASVSQNSVSVTLTSAPTYSVKGYYFSVNNTSELYKIAFHTAGSTSVTLETPYTGATASSASFKIWSGRVPLPAECRETIEVTHQWQNQPLEAVGLQEFRRLMAQSPKAEGRAAYYTTTQRVDPAPYSSITSLPALSTRASSGLVRTLVFASSVASLLSVGDQIEITQAGSSEYNGRFVISSVSTTTITYTASTDYNESATADATLTVTLKNQFIAEETYRELTLFPALYTAATTLQVDYIRDLPPLNNDSDEPLIPQEYRIVLLYGALHRIWARERNDSEAARNLQLYENTIAQMKGKLEDSVEYAQLKFDNKYLRTKRFGNKGLSANLNTNSSSGGGGAQAQVQGTANRVAIFSSTGYLIPEASVGDLTVSSNVIGITPGVIVDADVNASAAITRTKLASGNGYRILANNSSGEMSENAALTAGQMVITDANGQLTTTGAIPAAFTSFAMSDNQASAATILSWAHATYDSIKIEYSIKRGTSNKETGVMYLSTDGTNAAIAQSASNLGTIGVTFSVDVSGTDLRLRYTSTSTGTAPTFKYIVTQWLA